LGWKGNFKSEKRLLVTTISRGFKGGVQKENGDDAVKEGSVSKIMRSPNGNFKKGHSASRGGRKSMGLGNGMKNQPKTKISMSLIVEHACNELVITRWNF
jgi:hypothetical protein